MRHAFFDRNCALGDPDFVQNPVAQLLDKAYAAAIRAVIDPVRATPSAALGAGAPPHEGAETTHYSIVDAAGQRGRGDLHDERLVRHRSGRRRRTGFLMNDEMDDFTTKPGVPNMFGLVQGAANTIAPGKRR